MYGGFHDKDKLILLSEKMQVCISQIKCNDCAVGVMHLLWWLAIILRCRISKLCYKSFLDTQYSLRYDMTQLIKVQ